MVGTTTIRTSSAIGAGAGARSARRRPRTVRTAPASPISEVTIGSVHSTVVTQLSGPGRWPGAHAQPEKPSEPTRTTKKAATPGRTGLRRRVAVRGAGRVAGRAGGRGTGRAGMAVVADTAAAVDRTATVGPSGSRSPASASDGNGPLADIC